MVPCLDDDKAYYKLCFVNQPKKMVAKGAKDFQGFTYPTPHRSTLLLFLTTQFLPGETKPKKTGAFGPRCRKGTAAQLRSIQEVFRSCVTTVDGSEILQQPPGWDV